MNYGRAVRVARAARKLSQKELAQQAGLDASYVSLIESERRVPTVAALRVLGKALGVPPHLMALLAAEEDDLSGLSPHQAGILGKDLLEVLVGGRSQGEDPSR
jgi:transcriptional regulator with XRE-family HTH domain